MGSRYHAAIRPLRWRAVALLAVALALVAVPDARAVDVTCALNGSVTLSNPNPGMLGSSVTAVPSKGVIEQSVNGSAFFVKSVGSPISWSGNSIVNYRNTSAGSTDSFSIGGFVFNVTLESGQPPTPTTTTTSDVTITYSANAQAIQVSAHVSPTPPSGTVTFSIPGAGSNSAAVVNAQGNATGNFVVNGGTPSGNYTITATFNGPANYASSSGTATLHLNFYATTTTPAAVTTTYSPSANGLTLNAAVTSPFGGTVNTGTVTFTVRSGPTVIGNPVGSGTVTNNAASANFSLPAGTGATTYSITAEYGGGGNFAPSSGSTTLTVNKANQTIGFADLPSVAYGIAPFGLTATGGATGNPVTFSVLSGPGSINGTTLTVTGSGAITIQADQAGNTNYNTAQTSKVQTVTKAHLTVKADSLSKPAGAANPPLTYQITGFVNGDNASVVVGVPALSTVATDVSPPGSYFITVGPGRSAQPATTSGSSSACSRSRSRRPPARRRHHVHHLRHVAGIDGDQHDDDRWRHVHQHLAGGGGPPRRRRSHRHRRPPRSRPAARRRRRSRRSTAGCWHWSATSGRAPSRRRRPTSWSRGSRRRRRARTWPPRWSPRRSYGRRAHGSSRRRST